MSEQFLAQAQILVTPNTATFRAQLLADLAKANKGVVVRVAVLPDMKGFRAALQEGVSKSSTGVVARVLVRPDMTGFRAALQAAVTKASAGVTVPTSITPSKASAVGANALTTGSVVDKRVATAQLAITKATDAGVAARRRFDKSLSDSEKQMLRDVRVAEQLRTSTAAVSAAAVSGIPALQAQAEALHLSAVAADEANKARKVRAAAPAAREAQEAAAAIAATKQQADALKQVAAQSAAVLNASRKLGAAQQAESAARIASLQDEVRGLLAIDKTEDDRRKKLIGDARKARITGRTRTGTEIGDEAIQRNLAFEDSADSAARAETDFANARRNAARAAVLANEPEQALAATRAAQRAAIDEVVERQIAYETALKAEIPTLVAVREQELALAQARLVEAQAATKAAEAQVVQAGRIGAARRALEAFGATLAGLRGAALSAQGAFIAAAAGAIAVTKAVQSAAAFESTLNTFRVTASATADEMERVREVSLELGQDITLPGVGAQDAADALTELSKAGLSVQDSIDGARGVLQLATAASIDNQQATELAASALNAFGLAGNQAVRVADTLANAANASQGSIVDIGVALQQAAAVARQAGLNLEQTVGVLTLFARAGLKGSDAGTSLRTALIRLINPTAKAQKEIDQLGLHLRTATGAINLDVFSEFARKTEDLTQAQRDQALAIIFGQDAIRGAAILAREGAQGLDDQVAALRRQGTAAELANARMTGFTGSLENLKNQLSSVGITIGNILIPPLKLVTDVMAESIGIVNDLASQFLSLRDAAVKAADALADKFDIKIGGVDVDKEGKDLGQRIIDNAGPVIRKGIISSIPVIGPALVQLDAFSNLFGPAATDANKVRIQVNQILRGLKGADEVAQGIAFTSVVGQLTQLQKKLAGGDKDAQHLASEISDIIAQLKEGNALPPFAFPKVELPDDLKEGLPGKQAGDAIFAAFDAALPGPKVTGIGFNFMQNFRDGLVAGAAQIDISSVVDKVQRDLERLLNQAGRQLRLSVGRLQSQALQLQVEGASPQDLLANAQQQLQKAQRLLDLGVTRGLPRAEIDKRRRDVIDAQNLVEGFQNDITANAEKVKQDAKDKAAKIKKANDDADQAILDAFAPSQASLQQRQTRAEGTTRLSDNRRVLVDQRKQLQDEIKQIDANFNDRKQAAAAIATRRDQILQLNNELADLNQQIIESSFERRQTRLERQQTTAEQFGDIRAQRRIITQRIKEYDALIKDFKGEKDKLDELKDARDQLEQDRKNLRTTQLQAQVDLAQSIFDLTGNKNPLLKALDAQIADQRRQIAAAKKAGHSTVLLRTELNKMLKARKDALDDAADQAKQGTTAFDLLKQFSDTFNNVAGNLINANQPFAGPTGFTADIAQFLKRRQQTGTTGPITPSGKSRVELSNDLLIRAINRLIASTDANTNAKGGNAPAGETITGTPLPKGTPWSDVRFYKAAQARAAAEAGG